MSGDKAGIRPSGRHRAPDFRTPLDFRRVRRRGCRTTLHTSQQRRSSFGERHRVRHIPAASHKRPVTTACTRLRRHHSMAGNYRAARTQVHKCHDRYGSRAPPFFVSAVLAQRIYESTWPEASTFTTFTVTHYERGLHTTGSTRVRSNPGC